MPIPLGEIFIFETDVGIVLVLFIAKQTNDKIVKYLI